MKAHHVKHHFAHQKSGETGWSLPASPVGPGSTGQQLLNPCEGPGVVFGAGAHTELPPSCSRVQVGRGHRSEGGAGALRAPRADFSPERKAEVAARREERCAQQVGRR